MKNPAITLNMVLENDSINVMAGTFQLIPTITGFM